MFLRCRVLQPYTDSELRGMREQGESEAHGTEGPSPPQEEGVGGHGKVYTGAGWVDPSETDLGGALYVGSFRLAGEEGGTHHQIKLVLLSVLSRL